MGDCRRRGRELACNFPSQPRLFWRLKILSWCRRDGAGFNRPNAYVTLRSRYTGPLAAWVGPMVAQATVEIAGLPFRSFEGRRRRSSSATMRPGASLPPAGRRKPSAQGGRRGRRPLEKRNERWAGRKVSRQLQPPRSESGRSGFAHIASARRPFWLFPVLEAAPGGGLSFRSPSLSAAVISPARCPARKLRIKFQISSRSFY